ncbi:Tetrathionate reductase subunit A [hydrothermal vent metagenome]|uniref:Tetrathionate reductase subunit A n=1 Tax=hydrothermal vent metagenome TaxID=652676 RepID=A0A3B1BJH1_9ZZZZ
MTSSRRNFIKGATAVGAAGAFGFGYSHTASQMLKAALAEDFPADPIFGNAAKPEFTVDLKTGKLEVNPDQTVAYTMCMGCTTVCGVRVRIDNKTQKVLRVTGNPYHVLSSDPFLPYETSVRDSFQALSRYQEKGLLSRSTACGRGNAVLDKLTSPERVKVPLKRVGPRGSEVWAPISFEQLIEEVVEGGDLFGEGHVEGLRAIRDIKTPIDPEQPEFGSKSNQLAVMAPFKDGRLRFAARFAKLSFGTVNFTGHRSYCGLSMRAGYAALLGNWKKMPHLKPDFSNSEFLMFIGTAPGNAGNPFKRQGKLIAQARSEGKLKYVVIDPVLTNSDNLAADDRSRWIPIKPNTDGALVMGMIRWILEKQRYDEKFLRQPGPVAAELAGEASWSNATHLVIVEPDHPRHGKFLRSTDLDPSIVVKKSKKGKKSKPAPALVMDVITGKAMAFNRAGPADLFYQGTLKTVDGNDIAVSSSLSLLKAEADKFSLDEYADICGIPADTIIELAREFTSHGKRAAVDTHGGTMGSNGFYNAFAIVMLNALVGNLNWKGGTSIGGGRYKEIAPGPRYNLKKFPGKVKPKGLGLGRNHLPYEKSSEYKQKVAQGKNPYPAKAPWFSLSPAMSSEYLNSALNGYPYRLKALILWSSNPLYGIAGMSTQVREKLADPKELPLIISIDPFINESNTYADYIVPDTVLYESWGWASAWGGNLTRVSTARWPVVKSDIAETAEGVRIEMESFFIAVAKRMDLPGFGEGAIKDKQGNKYALNRAEDFYLRAAANVAYAGNAVPDVSDEELSLSGVDRISAKLKQVLKAEEWRKVAYVYARGGRFENSDQAYKGAWLKYRYKKPMQIYDEYLAGARNSLTGKSYIGSPTWMQPKLADGSLLSETFSEKQWPFKVISTKSNLQSSHTIGLASLQQIHPKNGISIHVDDAAKLGISSGDQIRITTPGGSVVGAALVRHGIQPGVLGIEHGFGHRQLGARAQRMGNTLQKANRLSGYGVNINDLGFADPRRKGLSVLTDWVVGNVARQGLPARVERV